MLVHNHYHLGMQMIGYIYIRDVTYTCLLGHTYIHTPGHTGHTGNNEMDISYVDCKELA